MKRGLGKGLDALIAGAEDNEAQINEVKINDVEPNLNQPRKEFDAEKLNRMAASIKEHGIIQPIVVRKRDDKYEIIAGERRWRAARIAGLHKVPIIVKELNDQQMMEAALIENLQREDLNAIEEANGYDMLVKKYKLTQDEIAQMVGKSRPAIANTIRLLTLDERVKELIIDGKLSAGHARTLVVVQDNDLQYEVAKKIISNDLSVREAEILLGSIEKKKTIKKKASNPILKEIENNLKNILGTKVRIVNNKNKGKIEIEYYSNEDLERIIELIRD